jgi:hypothetical protein
LVEIKMNLPRPIHQIDKARLNRVEMHNEKIVGFASRFNLAPSAIKPFCEGSDVSVLGLECPFREICAMVISKGQLSILGWPIVRVSGIAMNANCTVAATSDEGDARPLMNKLPRRLLAPVPLKKAQLLRHK